VKNKTKTRLD